MTRWVLVTRSPADCQELQRLLDGTDLKIRPYPVLRLEDVTDDEGWHAATTAATDPSSWVVVTSPRAPERLCRQAADRSATQLLERPLAVVGPSTARAVEAAGLTPDLIGPGTGAGLAAALAARLEPQAPVISACGADHRPELTRTLTAAGHPVTRLVVYRMVPTPPRELPPLGPSLEAVVLTSPRAARLYLEGVGGLPLPCEHWALGPTTQGAATGLGIDCRVPARPDLESLAEELCRT